MVPRAKKNLHECVHHLGQMKQAKHFEELEISFAAFVRSGREVTWVLQKEFINHARFSEEFVKWYGDRENPAEGTKAYEMANDELCRYFLNTRNSIEKEGINGLVCNLKLASFDSSKDIVDAPANSSLIIKGSGIYHLVNEGTSEEDLVPAKTTAELTTFVFIGDPPSVHLNQPVPSNDIFTLSDLYFTYLRGLVEEWTGILNT